MLTLICGHCQQPFQSRGSRRRFCSIRCRSVANTRPAADRFWEKVNKAGPVPPHRQKLGPCWIWTGGMSNGYGTFSVDGTRSSAHRTSNAHRFAFELENGPIDKDIYVCHHCDNRPCVRPSHLFLGTATDNMHDLMDKGRMPNGLTKPDAKLNPAIVRIIRKMYADGADVMTIAKALRTSHGATWAVAHGVTWKHVA